MGYELGSFIGVNIDPLVIIACLIIVKFQNNYLRVILYAIAYAVVRRSPKKFIKLNKHFKS